MFDAGEVLANPGSADVIPKAWGTSGGPYVPLGNAWDFIGVEDSSLRITGPNGGDYNAYEYHEGAVNSGRRYNVVVPYQAILPAVQISGASPMPSVNIAAFTGWDDHGTGQWNQPVERGILYVRDLFYNMHWNQHLAGATTHLGLPGSDEANFDNSAMDFRICPAAAFGGREVVSPAQLKPPSQLNPLVNRGWSNGFPITMANALVLANPPGWLSLPSQGEWPHHPWTHDCEGAGNARIHEHLAYLPPNAESHTDTDIGADELGDVLVAGFRYGTTAYVAFHADINKTLRPEPQKVTRSSNRYQWYLGPPAALAMRPMGNAALPYYRQYAAISGLGSAPATLPTALPPYQTTTPALNPGWRSEFAEFGHPGDFAYKVTDITGHLRPDVHPWWSNGAIVASNPVWQYCSPYAGIYNPLLYWNPASGIVNPPGMLDGHPDGAPVRFAWLDGRWYWTTATLPVTDAEFAQFGPFASPSLPPQLLSGFDALCRGVGHLSGSGTFDILPATYVLASPPFIGMALRYTLEKRDHGFWHSGIAANNVQAFEIIVEY